MSTSPTERASETGATKSPLADISNWVVNIKGTTFPLGQFDPNAARILNQPTINFVDDNHPAKLSDVFAQWIAESKKPTTPSDLQLELAEFISEKVGYTVDPLSIYPTSSSTAVGTMDHLVELSVTFNYDQPTS
jgi:hypothetical protein